MIYMKDKITNHHIRLRTIIILMIITSIVSGLTSGVIVYSSYSKNAGISYKTINEDPSLKEFLEVYSQITNEYYEDVNKTELIKAAISSMLNYLDDSYTTYLNDNQTKQLDKSLNGSYKGIGVLISDRKIVEVFDDSPAKSAGVLVNDIIIKVNNEDVSKKTSDEISTMIRSTNQKEVLLTVERNGKEIELVITLSTLDVPVVDYKVIDNTSIGYIELSSFSSTAAKQVEKVLKEFENKNVTSLIIDLRSNTGGYLSAAEDIASLFLEKGKIIYSLKTKNDELVVKDKTASKTNYKIIVLIDNNTASASEILAASLKESYGATIVGKTSFGKGKVQQTMRLKDGSMAKYTSAKWFTPNGSSIDGKGIIPDFDVDLLVEKDEGTKTVKVTDSQLNKAIELLS